MFQTATTTIDQREQEFIACERAIGKIRARELELVRSLDSDQVTQLDGSRSMADWVAARLDTSTEAARQLVRAAKSLEEHPQLAAALAGGRVSFDRAVATARLLAAGASSEQVEASFGFDLNGVARITARHRRMTRVSEQAAYRDRFLAIQPSFDESAWRLWGQLPGYEGRIVEKALSERADAFPSTGDDRRVGRGERTADALVAIAQDSLDGAATGNGSTTPLVSVFVDADLAETSNGEAGAEIAVGPRVGPATLERILCGGRVQLVGVRGNKPVWYGRSSRSIPPAIRRFVLKRDGGCVIDGCSSRYRLEPHHIVPWSKSRCHDPDNLVTLCWYHHHVAIHGEGYRLEPGTPPQRRRLVAPRRGPDPP